MSPSVPWEGGGTGKGRRGDDPPRTLESSSSISFCCTWCQSCSCPVTLLSISPISPFSCSTAASNWAQLTLPARAALSAFWDGE